MEKTIEIKITESRLRYIESKYPTKLLLENVEVINLYDFVNHNKVLSRFLLVSGIPLIFTSAIMRMNGIRSQTIPEHMNSIKIISPSVIKDIVDDILSIDSETYQTLDLF